MRIIKKYYNISKLFGKKIHEEDNYRSYYGGNPSDLMYLYIQTINTDGSTAIDILLDTEITFYAKLYERVL